MMCLSFISAKEIASLREASLGTRFTLSLFLLLSRAFYSPLCLHFTDCFFSALTGLPQEPQRAT